MIKDIDWRAYLELWDHKNFILENTVMVCDSYIDVTWREMLKVKSYDNAG